jgi:hypothetical protein
MRILMFNKEATLCRARGYSRYKPSFRRPSSVNRFGPWLPGLLNHHLARLGPSAAHLGQVTRCHHYGK